MLIKMGSNKMAYNNAELFQLLSSGGKYSVIDIMQRLNVSDPRSAIRDLRAIGVCVKDEWVPTRGGGRYKRYWIDF